MTTIQQRIPVPGNNSNCKFMEYFGVLHFHTCGHIFNFGRQSKFPIDLINSIDSPDDDATAKTFSLGARSICLSFWRVVTHLSLPFAAADLNRFFLIYRERHMDFFVWHRTTHSCFHANKTERNWTEFTLNCLSVCVCESVWRWPPHPKKGPKSWLHEQINYRNFVCFWILAGVASERARERVITFIRPTYAHTNAHSNAYTHETRRKTMAEADRPEAIRHQ